MLLLRRFLLFTTVVLPLSAFAERFYFNETGVELPHGVVAAIEARCKLPAAKSTRGNVASWSIKWGNDSATVTFNSSMAADGVGSMLVRFDCGGESTQLTSNDHFDGWNSLAIEWSPDGLSANLLFGGNALKPIMTVTGLARPVGPIEVTSSHPQSLKLQEIIVETENSPFERLKVDSDVSDLPLWHYLDMATDSEQTTTARRGGRYALSLLPQSYGFDIIYRMGAEVNADAWAEPMLKGRLISHGFAGHYELRWFDALGRDVPGEHYALLDLTQQILTLEFPSLGAKLRFAR